MACIKMAILFNLDRGAFVGARAEQDSLIVIDSVYVICDEYLLPCGLFISFIFKVNGKIRYQTVEASKAPVSSLLSQSGK